MTLSKESKNCRSEKTADGTLFITVPFEQYEDLTRVVVQAEGTRFGTVYYPDHDNTVPKAVRRHNKNCALIRKNVVLRLISCAEKSRRIKDEVLYQEFRAKILKETNKNAYHLEEYVKKADVIRMLKSLENAGFGKKKVFYTLRRVVLFRMRKYDSAGRPYKTTLNT